MFRTTPQMRAAPTTALQLQWTWMWSTREIIAVGVSSLVGRGRQAIATREAHASRVTTGLVTCAFRLTGRASATATGTVGGTAANVAPIASAPRVATIPPHAKNLAGSKNRTRFPAAVSAGGGRPMEASASGRATVSPIETSTAARASLAPAQAGAIATATGCSTERRGSLTATTVFSATSKLHLATVCAAR